MNSTIYKYYFYHHKNIKRKKEKKNIIYVQKIYGITLEKIKYCQVKKNKPFFFI
jgi:hypothetical protein